MAVYVLGWAEIARFGHSEAKSPACGAERSQADGLDLPIRKSVTGHRPCRSYAALTVYAVMYVYGLNVAP